METRRLVGEGCGKLILFGEHAVVYGVAAIVAGLGTGATAAAHFSSDGGLEVTDGVTGKSLARVHRGQDDPLARAYEAILNTFDVSGPLGANVVLHLPVGSGLGSSAALAVAVSRAIQSITDADEALVERAVHAAEEVFHGQPSGIDQAAAMRGGIFRYRRGEEPHFLEVPDVRVLVCQAAPGASTARMVNLVKKRAGLYPKAFEGIFATISEVVAAAEPVLREGDWQRVGELMNINQGLLTALGVSTAPLDAACHVARERGAYGAKLTGAGGGGCVFALAPAARQDEILQAWGRRDWQTFAFDLET